MEQSWVGVAAAVKLRGVTHETYSDGRAGGSADRADVKYEKEHGQGALLQVSRSEQKLGKPTGETGLEAC